MFLWNPRFFLVFPSCRAVKYSSVIRFFFGLPSGIDMQTNECGGAVQTLIAASVPPKEHKSLPSFAPCGQCRWFT
uniref:Putative secreted protein n=1 Tax=Anopheles triannulatus TaxID=58253 RepID=A0A2M4B3B1_9DIPT